MNLNKLEQEKKQLEQQREQAIATINQITGALAVIDKLINDLLEEQKLEESEDKIKE